MRLPISESRGPRCDVAERLRAIEIGLAAAGLSTRLHDSPAGTDLTATLRRPGKREIEVVIDADGYTELRYWASLDVTPAHTVAIVTSALAVIAAATGLPDLVDLAGQTRKRVGGYDGAVTERAGESGMPGPRDHVAEQEHSPDPARPREPDHPREAPAQSADLQSRLERLPVGHPSSPYQGDGSRKPPPPDLADYELPLPDELPPDTDQPDPHLPTEDAARVDPDGSWHWKGRDLTPEQSRIADEALAKCRDAEGRDPDGNYGDHGLTPAMRRIEAQLDHGHLVKDTEKFALKDPDRFKEKLAERIAFQPDESATVIASRLHDGIRYTFQYDENQYTESVYRTETVAEQEGFDLIVRKPSWDGQQYKGINSQWRDPDSGLLFEVQFHTDASWEAKQKTHAAYERLSDPSTPPMEREALEEYQREVAASVPVPSGALEIPYYRKEGV
jgi:hypothetical protein